LDLVRDEADYGAAGLAHLVGGFGDAVLADDDDAHFAVELLHGLGDSERAGVGRGSDEDVAVFGMALEEVEDEPITLIMHAAAVDADEELGRNGLEPGANGFDAPVMRLCTSAPAGRGEFSPLKRRPRRTWGALGLEELQDIKGF
jgi:hypothetical protein